MSPIRLRYSPWLQDFPHLATRLGIALYAALSLAYVVLGEANSDEGWYLYASKLVLEGKLPFQDFAYTQMPLLPYIYGVVQIVRPSLMLGRITSLALSLGTLIMCIAIARRHAGRWAGGMTALFLAAFTFGVYFNAIVKTYSLVTFFFVATLLVLSSDLNETSKYPLALVFAFASAMVRVTGIVFVAPILLYALGAPRRGITRVLVLLTSAAASLLMAFYLLPDWQAARWNLFDSHLRHWAGAQVSTQVYHILADRLPFIIQSYAPPLVLFVASLFFLARHPQLGRWLRQRLDLLVFALALGLFSASHLVNGLWETEYLVPAMTAFLPVVAVVLSEAYHALARDSRVFVQGTMLAAFLLLPMTESIQHVDITGRRLPIAEIDQVATVVAQNTQPTDKVLALETLGAVLDANRSTLPGLTLAQFSVQLMDDETAERLHVVNVKKLAEVVEQTEAPIVVLTDQDVGLLYASDAPYADALQRSLNERYRVVLTIPYFGPFADTVNVYIKQ